MEENKQVDGAAPMAEVTTNEEPVEEISEATIETTEEAGSEEVSEAPIEEAKSEEVSKE